MVSAISQLLFMSVKSVTNRPASAPEHMKLQLHQHFDTHMEPSCSLHKIYKPHSPLDQNCKNDCSPKGPTWSLCLYKAVVGQGGQPFVPQCNRCNSARCTHGADRF